MITRRKRRNGKNKESSLKKERKARYKALLDFEIKSNSKQLAEKNDV